MDLGLEESSGVYLTQNGNLGCTTTAKITPKKTEISVLENLSFGGGVICGR